MRRLLAAALAAAIALAFGGGAVVLAISGQARAAIGGQLRAAAEPPAPAPAPTATVPCYPAQAVAQAVSDAAGQERLRGAIAGQPASVWLAPDGRLFVTVQLEGGFACVLAIGTGFAPVRHRMHIRERAPQ